MTTDDKELKLAREIVAEHKPDTRLSRMMLDIYAHHEGFLVQIALAAIKAGRAAGVAEERERCAKIAENFTGAKWAAYDMASGTFPKQSRMEQAIAAAIKGGERE